jgi:hypothetical protein
LPAVSLSNPLSAASNGSDRNGFPLRGNDKHAPFIEEPLIPHSPFIGRKQVFGLMKQSAYKDNAIGRVDETRALRTNRIWSKGRVEYTKLTVPSLPRRSAAKTGVNLRNLRLQILCELCVLSGLKKYCNLCLKKSACHGDLSRRSAAKTEVRDEAGWLKNFVMMQYISIYAYTYILSRPHANPQSSIRHRVSSIENQVSGIEDGLVTAKSETKAEVKNA